MPWSVPCLLGWAFPEPRGLPVSSPLAWVLPLGNHPVFVRVAWLPVVWLPRGPDPAGVCVPCPQSSLAPSNRRAVHRSSSNMSSSAAHLHVFHMPLVSSKHTVVFQGLLKLLQKARAGSWCSSDRMLCSGGSSGPLIFVTYWRAMCKLTSTRRRECPGTPGFLTTRSSGTSDTTLGSLMPTMCVLVLEPP